MASLGCMLIACVTSHVNAFAGPVVDTQLVHQVAPLNKEDWGDLQFQEFSGEMRNALALSGFKVGEKAEQEPEVVILTEYGIGPPQKATVTTYSTQYAWVNSGGGTATVRPAFGDPKLGYNVTATPNQSYQAVGQTPQTQTVTTYVRHLTATAYDYKIYKATHEMRQVWKVSVVSEGSGDDLRSLLPVMIAAARPYFGKSTGRQVEVQSRVNAPEVEAVRTGVMPAKRR